MKCKSCIGKVDQFAKGIILENLRLSFIVDLSLHTDTVSQCLTFSEYGAHSLIISNLNTGFEAIVVLLLYQVVQTFLNTPIMC